MAYNDFSGGGTLPLVAAWNTGDTGTLHFLPETNNVTLMEASEGVAPFSLESTGDSGIYYVNPGDPLALDQLAGLVGEAKDWFRLGNASPLSIDVSEGHTVIVLSRIPDRAFISGVAYSGPGYLYAGYDYGGYVGVRSDAYGAQTLDIRVSATNPALQVAANVANNSEVLAIACGSASDSGTVYRDKIVIGDNQPVDLRGGVLEHFAMMGKASLDSTTGTTDVNVAICALYNRKLTQQEIEDITDLMRHWEANGSAPGSDTAPVVTSPTPPSQSVTSPDGTQFTASAIGSPNPDIQWKACPAAADETDKINWLDAEAVLGGDVTLPTTSGTIQITRTVPADDGVKLELWGSNTVESDVRPSTHATLNVSTTTYPTSTFFGPVLTVDTSATLKWQWSSNQADWYDVDDGVNGIDSVGIDATETGVEAGDNNTIQANNQLNILSATAEQVVYTRCKATTGYDEIFSSVNTLTIVEAP